jgi:hypothetical protein
MSGMFTPCPTENCRYLQGHMGRCSIGLRQAFTTLPDHYQPAAHFPGPYGLLSGTGPASPRLAADHAKAKDAQAREMAARGELTLWAARPGQESLGIWGLLRSFAGSPVGAMWALGLLVLCWLSGCA